MGLLARLEKVPGTTDGISVHRFAAALGEVQAGGITPAQAKAALSLSGDDANAAQEIMDKISLANITRERVDDILILLENNDYTVSQARTRLGITGG